MLSVTYKPIMLSVVYAECHYTGRLGAIFWTHQLKLELPIIYVRAHIHKDVVIRSQCCKHFTLVNICTLVNYSCSLQARTRACTL